MTLNIGCEVTVLYMDYEVEIPSVQGRINHVKKGDVDYIRYVVGRTYHADRKYNIPDQKIIGKRSKTDANRMIPNENFLKYFPEIEAPKEMDRSARSSSLRIGDYIVIRKILEEYSLPEILGEYLPGRELGLFLDLVAYTIVTEDNAAQYYPDYAYDHPLFTEGMHIYSDSKVSEFLRTLTEDRSVRFLNDWNGIHDHREKIYISYDSTNKNSQAGDIEIVEFGHPKTDVGLPVFNYAVAYDTHNREPLFYEKYPGSVNDISQLEFVLDKAYGYGYRRIGFILDRGYFSRENLRMMDEKGYSFVIMAKGMAAFLDGVIDEVKGKFESKRGSYIDEYETYGTTVVKKLFESEEKERCIHVYHSTDKEGAERKQTESSIRQMKLFLNKHKGEKRQFGKGFEEYFILHYDKGTGQFLFAEERAGVIEKELEHSGYYCIVTSEKMTAKDALNLYKSRDASEKLFRGDKSYLGNSSLRVHTDDAANGRIFIEFVALIVRNRIYTCLKRKQKEMAKRPNYMTVPAALRELEKIEMVRLTDGKYRLDHAVTKTQKTILDAFGIDAAYVKYRAEEIGRKLAK